jgi:Lipid A core - O-antigen ligase and related enzymes
VELAIVIYLSFSSCFCTFVLNRQMAGFFLALIATFYAMHGAPFLFCITIAIFMQSAHLFISQKKSTILWIIISVVVCYSIAIFVFQPYKIYPGYFATYVTTLLVFIWAALIKWDSKKIITIVTALGIYLVIFGFAEWLIIGSQRIQGPLSVATAYAVVLVLIWTIWFVENCFSHRFSNFIIFIGTLLVFVAVLLSGTRMGVIGIAMGLLFGITLSSWTIKFKNNTFFQKIFYSVFAFCCMLLFIFIAWTLIPNDLYIKQALNTILSGKVDSSNMGRVTSWITALKIIPENKIWGIGPGNFLDIHKSFLQTLPLNNNIPRGALKHSHNMYLMILSEFGISGFLIFAFIIIACFMQLFHRLKNNSSVGIYYAFLSSGIIMMTLGMVDIIPLDLYTIGWGGWYMGVLASFSLANESTAK